MPQIYVPGESIEPFARDLIRTYHPELATANIRYYFREKAGKKNGKIVYGSAKKVSDVLQFLLEDGRGETARYDFLIEVALDTWNEMNSDQRNALVDHLLERCSGEEDEEDGGAMKWKLREPDVNEFSTILNRHGTWNESLNGFVTVAKTLGIDEEEEVDTSVASQVALQN